MASGTRGGAAATAVPAGAQSFSASGVLSEIKTMTFGNKTLYTYVVDGTWYGAGDKDIADVYVGDTIAFDWKNGKANPKKPGEFYKNLIPNSVTVTQEGAGAAPAAAGDTIAPATTAAPAQGDIQKMIVMQAMSKAGTQLLGDAIACGALKLPNKDKLGALLGFADRIIDHLYLKSITTELHPTLDGDLVDSLDDDDNGFTDDDDFDS